MYKIAASVPDGGDVTSSYRGMGPLNHLRTVCRNIDIVSMQTWRWDTIGSCDMVFMQRPYTDNHVGILDIAKKARKPIWIDYDDLLLGVPTDNPTYFQYMDPKVQKNIVALLKGADVVTVSTGHLAKLLSGIGIGAKIKVIPNAMDLDSMGERPTPLPRKNIVMWRGSRTHQRDVFTYAQSMLELNAKKEDWMWHFLGDTMWFVTDSMVHERTYITKPLELSAFNEFIAGRAPSVLIVPLHYSDFNLAKSNIAWFDATWAGAICLAPNWPEWNKPGVVTYDHELDFKEKLEAIMDGKFDIESHVEQSWTYIQSNYLLRNVNLHRADVIASSLGVSLEDLGWRLKVT